MKIESQRLKKKKNNIEEIKSNWVETNNRKTKEETKNGAIKRTKTRIGNIQKE